MRMMLVDVFHDGKHVASVSGQFANQGAALEYAYRWTQNIEGSWSCGPEITLRSGQVIDNRDYNQAVIWKAPLEGGMGHRSSMVGDTFTVADQGDCVEYQVASCGFDRVEREAA